MTRELELNKKNAFEFEVTMCQHMKPNALMGRERTVTACFKEPPEGTAEEAWRVLDEAVGRESGAMMQWPIRRTLPRPYLHACAIPVALDTLCVLVCCSFSSNVNKLREESPSCHA